jgi:hypothetical protein
MACGLSQNLNNRGCASAQTPGISKIYVTELANISSSLISSGSVTALTLNSGSFFQTYTPKKTVASATENVSISIPNGAITYEPEVTTTFSKMQAGVYSELQVLAQNDVVVAFQTYDQTNGVNSYFITGLNNGLNVSALKAETGKSGGTDLNGYTLTLKGSEPVGLLQITGSLITPLTH